MIGAGGTGTPDLSETLFELESRQFGEARLLEARARFDSLHAALDLRRLHRYSASDQAAYLSGYVFGTSGFRCGLGDPTERFTLCGTLTNHCGSCLGLTTLIVCLGKKLQIPLRPALYEQHIAVCHCGADPPFHIETTRGGEVLPDRVVDRLYGSRVWKPSLTNEEFLAVQLSNRAAIVLAAQGRLEDAVYVIEIALGLFPQYIGAWVNLATALVALGQFARSSCCLQYLQSLELGTRYRAIVTHLVSELGEMVGTPMWSTARVIGAVPSTGRYPCDTVKF